MTKTVTSVPSGDRQPLVLGDLTSEQWERTRLRLEHLLEVETGFRRGDPARALAGEPRAAYDPSATTLGQRRRAKVAELRALGAEETRVLGLGQVSATLSNLVTAPTQPPTASDVLDIAERLVGVPYVWGGVSPYGIDCSGLVYLAHRHLGVSVPRDADDQAAASRQLGSAEAQPGDLYFFARPGSAIHHVGIVRGDQETLHASGTAGRVQHDVLAGELANTLVATHRTVG